jgi:hypothetical protein
MLSDLDFLNKAEENLEWFHTNFLEIQEKYAGKQIAIKDKAIVAFAENGKKLLESLTDKNIDDSEVVIERIIPKGELRIL